MSPTPNRVVIADEDRPCADAVAMTLNANGIEANAVYDAWEALDRTVKWRPDCVVIDIAAANAGMVAYQLRHALHPPIRLVAYTEGVSASTRAAIAHVGFDQTVEKTGDPFELLHALNPELQSLALRSALVTITQARMQLTLAQGFLVQAELARDPPYSARLVALVQKSMDRLEAWLRHAAIPEKDREALYSELEAIRARAAAR